MHRRNETFVQLQEPHGDSDGSDSNYNSDAGNGDTR
jgi:hypothetical protein